VLWGPVPLAEPQCECHHIHDRGEWDPVPDGDGYAFPSTMEAEYTAALAFNIAIAMTRAVVNQGWAMAVPPFIAAEEVGDRREACGRPAHCTRSTALPAVAGQLQLQPPAE
jgi:hypothetical protein